MINCRRLFFGIALLFGITTACLFSSPALARGEVAENLDDVHQVEDMIKFSRFGVSRGLIEYLVMLGPEFRERLGTLKPGELWIDLGHGNGIALRQYLVWRDEELHAAIDAHRGLSDEMKAKLRDFHLPPVRERGNVFGIGYHTPVSKGAKALFDRVNYMDRERSGWFGLGRSKHYGEKTGEFFLQMDRRELQRILSRGTLVTSLYGLLDYETDFVPMFSFIMNSVPKDTLLSAIMFPYSLNFGDVNGNVPMGEGNWKDFSWIAKKRSNWIHSITGVKLLNFTAYDDLQLALRTTGGPVEWADIDQKKTNFLETQSPPERVFYMPSVDCEDFLGAVALPDSL